MILLEINGLFLFGVYKQVIGGQKFDDKLMSNIGLLIAIGRTLLFTFLFISFPLDTIIKKNGI